MRILLIGATGTIGTAIAAALIGRHEVIRASRRGADQQVNLAEVASIRALFERVGRVDAVVSAAGQATLKPLAGLSDDDFGLSLGDKLMGQVNLVRYGMASVNDRGSITLTSGVLAHEPEPGFRGHVYSVISGRGVPTAAELGVLERYLGSTAGI